MNDWDILVILFNTANIIFLAAFMAKKIVWLRLLTITGMMVSIPYYLYFQEAPLWNNIFWVCTYAFINLVMLFVEFHCLDYYLFYNQLGNALYYLPRK